MLSYMKVRINVLETASGYGTLGVSPVSYISVVVRHHTHTPASSTNGPKQKDRRSFRRPHDHGAFLLSFCWLTSRLLLRHVFTPHGVHNTTHLLSLTTGVINENQAFVVVTHNF